MNVNNVRIRLATNADTAAISKLVSSLSREFITPELTDEGAATLLSSMSEPAVCSYFELGYRFHVAEVHESFGEQTAGCQIVGVAATRDNNHLYYLFVAKSHQRRGLGRRLWETARSACLRAGYTGTFTVNASSFSIPVYERFGFVKASGPVAHKGVISTPMRLDMKSP